MAGGGRGGLAAQVEEWCRQPGGGGGVTGARAPRSLRQRRGTSEGGRGAASGGGRSHGWRSGMSNRAVRTAGGEAVSSAAGGKAGGHCCGCPTSSVSLNRELCSLLIHISDRPKFSCRIFAKCSSKYGATSSICWSTTK